MKELLKQLKDLYSNGGHCVDENFNKFKNYIEEYSNKTGDYSYNSYTEDIIDEDTALERISNLYTLADIYDYINGNTDGVLYQDVYGRLEDFDNCDLDNTIEEVIDDIEERIEKEINSKVIDAIKEFNKELINNNSQCNVLTDEYAEKLGKRLCEKFKFEVKEN